MHPPLMRIWNQMQSYAITCGHVRSRSIVVNHHGIAMRQAHEHSHPLCAQAHEMSPLPALERSQLHSRPFHSSTDQACAAVAAQRAAARGLLKGIRALRVVCRPGATPARLLRMLATLGRAEEQLARRYLLLGRPGRAVASLHRAARTHAAKSPTVPLPCTPLHQLGHPATHIATPSSSHAYPVSLPAVSRRLPLPATPAVQVLLQAGEPYEWK